MNPVEVHSRGDQASRRDDARRDLHEAVAKARLNGRSRELEQALNALGKIEREDGNMVQAMACYEEIVALDLAHDDRLGVAQALHHLGDIHRENDCFGLAGLCYQEATAIYASHQHAPPLDFADALRSVAVYRQEAGDAEGAARLWRAALEIYAALGINSGVRECKHWLSDLQGDLAMAG